MDRGPLEDEGEREPAGQEGNAPTARIDHHPFPFSPSNVPYTNATGTFAFSPLLLDLTVRRRRTTTTTAAATTTTTKKKKKKNSRGSNGQLSLGVYIARWLSFVFLDVP